MAMRKMTEVEKRVVELLKSSHLGLLSESQIYKGISDKSILIVRGALLKLTEYGELGYRQESYYLRDIDEME